MAYKSWKPLRNTAVGRRCWMGKLLLCWQCREYQFLRLFLDCSDSTKFQFVFSHLFLWSCFEACPSYLYCHQQLFSCYMYNGKDDMNMVLNKGHTDEAILMHYWPCLQSGWLDIIWLLFLAYMWTNTKSRSRKIFKKELGWYLAIFTDQPWSIKDLWFREVHSCRTNEGNSNWAILVSLSRVDKQCWWPPILPATSIHQLIKTK